MRLAQGYALSGQTHSNSTSFILVPSMIKISSIALVTYRLASRWLAEDGRGGIIKIRFVDTDSMIGNVMELDDGASKTLIYNWRTDERTYSDDSDNPWASERNSLKLYFLPSSSCLQISSRRRALPCTDIILVKQTTAVWIRVRPFIAAVFSGPLNPIDQARVREICMNSLNNWTVFDYEEDLKGITLGSGFGKVTIVQL
ncbi:hypothetical protein EDD85DRAFT_937583 [Armillaria nabsnona]|nr:hypothetical protein EDD85DRAFT_937583 [Armillaria nabsnona]